MREIKFRVWDKSHKVFIPEEYWAVINNHNGSFGVIIKDWDNYREGEYFYSNSQVLQQYTGIKDCNGVEIYEGDVVNAFAQKEYEEESTVSDIIFSYNLQFKVRAGEFSCGLPLSWGGWETLTVIGNIYQNPEYAK